MKYLRQTLVPATIFAAAVLPGWATVVPVGYADSLVGNFAGGPTNGYGDLAVDAAGNVYSTTPFSGLLTKFAAGGGVTQLGASGGNSLSLALSGNQLFSGYSGGQIRMTNLNTNTTTALATVPSDALTMAFAPTGFGALGGQLIVGAISGIYAVNTSTSAVSTILSGSSYWDGMAFNSAGELIVGSYFSGQVSKVSAGGTVTNLFSIGGGLGAVAVRQDNGEIYVANENNGTIMRFSAAGASLGVFASGIQWDGGYWPSALTFSVDGSSLYYTEVPSNHPNAGVRKISGFAAYAGNQNAVPDAASTLVLILGAMAGFSVLRRARRA